MNFDAIARDVAAMFVHSVVVVDDRAFQLAALPTPQAIDDLVIPEGQETAPAKQMNGAIAPDSPNPSLGNASMPPEESRAKAEVLDGPGLMKHFAKKGLLCAIIAPGAGENGVADTTAAARRADVVVLDWIINNDDGNAALEIIRAILEEDAACHGRLRLIVIYTGEMILDQVLGRVATEAGKVVQDLKMDATGLALQNDCVRVVALLKNHLPVPPEATHYAANQLDEKSLPDRIHQEFAKLTAGLVSHVALRSLSLLRDNTHALLAHLHRGLDPAFLTHRALLPVPDDSLDHLVDLVADEMASMLHGMEAGKVSDADSATAWIARRATYEFRKDPSKEPPEFVDVPAAGLTKLVVGGRKAAHNLTMFSASELPRRLTGVLQGDASAAFDADAAFGMATSMVRRYRGAPLPRLSLGTVVQQSSGEFLVCIQGRCDSVRIKADEVRPFLFIPAKVAVDSSGKPSDRDFNLVVERGGKLVRLLTSAVYYEIQPLLFQAREGVGMVEAVARDGRGWEFSDTTGKKYEWIGQMKNVQALRLAHRLASSLSRVGLNESEWLRQIAEAAAK